MSEQEPKPKQETVKHDGGRIAINYIIRVLTTENKKEKKDK